MPGAPSSTHFSSRSDRLLIALTTIILLATTFSPGWRPVDAALYELLTAPARWTTQGEPSKVAVILIDQQSIEMIGAWPWGQGEYASALKFLDATQPKAIAITASVPPLPIRGAQAKLSQALKSANSESHKLLQETMTLLALDADYLAYTQPGNHIFTGLPSTATAPLVDSLTGYRLVAQAIRPLSKDSRWEQALDTLATWVAGHPPELRSHRYAMAVEDMLPPLPYAGGGPFSALLQPLAMSMREHLLPSLGLILYADSLGADATDIQLAGAGQLTVGEHAISTGSSMQILSSPQTVPVHSLHDLASDNALAAELNGTILVLGRSTDYGLVAAKAVARQTQDLIEGKVIALPSWTAPLRWLMILLSGWYLLRYAVIWSTAMSWLTTLGITAITVIFSLLAADLLGLWIAPLLPLSMLIGGHLLLTIKHNRLRMDLGTELNKTRHQLGQLLLQHDQLDAAWKSLRKAGDSAPVLRTLHALKTDLEAREQSRKAALVQRHIETMRPGYRPRTTAKDGKKTATKRAPASAKSGKKLKKPGVRKPFDKTDVIDTTPALKQIGRYQIIEQIGRGAFATVYQAHDPQIDRRVAVKVIEWSDNRRDKVVQEAQKRFLREGQAAGKLTHPNIVDIYDVGQDPGHAYVVMELLQGKDLSAHTSAETLLPLPQVLTLTAEVARALDYAHAQGVVHRDIKPANIVFDAANNRTKITDFGVAALQNSSATRTGTVLGSPSYMSPEQVAGRKVDGRADIYSLTATLYQLLTGELPFTGETLTNVMYNITEGKHPSPRKIRPDLPVTLVRLISKGLQKSPNKRFQNGIEMAEALDRISARSG